MTELRVRRRGATSTEPVEEGNPLPVSVETPGVDYGDFETVTVSTVSKPLTQTKLLNYTQAFITVETAPVRFQVDGTLPTAAVGHQLDAGDTLSLDSRTQLTNFKAIRTGGTDAVLSVSYGA